MRLRLPHRLSIGSGFTITKIIPLLVASVCLVVLFIGFTSYQRSRAQATKGADPVAYWNFNEGIGSSLIDSSVNHHIASFGTGNSAPTWARDDECLSGKCLFFDGTNDYVSGGTGPSINISGSEITVSAWIRPMRLTGTQSIVVKGQSSQHWNYGLVLNSSSLVARHNNGDMMQPSSLTTNGWHQVQIVYSGGSDYYYLDGNLVGSTAESFQETTGGWPLTIGNAGGRTEFFKGYIDEVKIYDYARTATQVKADFTGRGTVNGVSSSLGTESKQFLSDGLVGYWKLDEGVGTSVVDFSGNGARSSAFSGNTSWATGKFGNGLSFDGSDDIVRIPESPGVDLGTTADSYTVSAWFKTSTNYGNVGAIVQKFGNASYMPFSLRINSLERVEFIVIDYSHSPTVFSTTAYSDGLWHQAVGVRDVKEKKLYVYVDGVLAAPPVKDTTDSDMFNNSDVTIGNGSGPAYDSADFNGQIDEVRIYNKAFNAAEVKKLYNAAPGPVMYFPLDEGISSGTVYDRSGSGYTGTIYNNPRVITGKFGKALNLEQSVPQVIDVGDQSGLYFSGPFTISMWVKRNASPSDVYGGYLISDYHSNCVASSFALKINGGTGGALNSVGFFWENGGIDPQATSTTILALDTWYYVTGSWDGATRKIYINGVLEGTNNTSQSRSDNGLNTVIGAPGSCSGLFAPAAVDEVKMYNYARSSSQIIEDMNVGHPVGGSPIGSQVGYWAFDEGWGDTAYDSSPQHQNADLSGSTNCPSATICPTWSQAGKFGKALYFGGLQTANGDSHVRLPNNAYDSLTEGALSFWIKADNAGDANQNIFGVAEDDNNGYSDYFALQYAAGGSLSFGAINNGSLVMASGTVPYANPTSWHHVVFNMGSSGNELFIDGIKKAVTYTTGSASTSVWFSDISENTTAYTIGCSDADGSDDNDCDDTELFQGSLDEFKLYSTPLTSDQVKTEFNAGKALVLGSASTGVGGTASSGAGDRSYCVPGDTSTCRPPLGEWQFNKDLGSTVIDTSGNNNNLTWSGTVTQPIVRGKNGSAGKFNGTDNALSLGHNISSDFINFTMEAWIKPAAFNQTEAMIMYNGEDPSGWGMSFGGGYGDNNKLYGLFGYVAWLDSGYTFTEINKWYHVVMTRDSVGTTSFYVNGVKTPNSYIMDPSYPSDFFEIGHMYGVGGRYFQGQIDDARVYDYARTPAQIAWSFNKGKPINWYTFDECSGNTLHDLSTTYTDTSTVNDMTIDLGAIGETASGTCSGTPGAWYNGATGKRGASLFFDGSDDQAMGISAPYDQVSDNFSMTAWVYPRKPLTLMAEGTESCGYNQSFVIYPTHGDNYGTAGSDASAGMLVGTNGVIVMEHTDGYNPCQLVYTKTISDWIHVAIVYSANRPKLYLNGTFVREGLQSARIVHPGAGFSDSSAGWFNSMFSGQLDDVRFYSYPLTPAQVKTIMNDGAVSFQ